MRYGMTVRLEHCGCDVTYVVAGNSLGAEGVEALASALSRLVQLTSLDLSCTYCVDVDVDCVFG